MSTWQAAGTILLLAGAFFVLLGSVGVLRLPDFYTRAHAATKPDTLGVILAMTGICLYLVDSEAGWFNPTTFKLILIAVFVAITNPASAHALGRVAMRAGLKPWIPHQNAGQGEN